MTNLVQKMGVGFATGSLLASTFATAAFADTNVVVGGNGAGSNNTVITSTSNYNSVSQTNNTTVESHIYSSANTGGNTANGNTGGNVTIDTGAAHSTVNVTVAGGTNEANVSPCGCVLGDTTVDVVGNGAHSDNLVVSSTSNKSSVKQKNNTLVLTSVLSSAKTGKNKASYNTGGTTGITTRNATSTVNVTVTGSSNTLNP